MFKDLGMTLETCQECQHQLHFSEQVTSHLGEYRITVAMTDEELIKLPDTVIVENELPFEGIYNFRDVGETINKHNSVTRRYAHV